MIITLDVIIAPTGRAKCHNCESLIMKAKPKGVIEVEVEVDGTMVLQNRSLCLTCTRKNVEALHTHTQNLLMKINGI